MSAFAKLADVAMVTSGVAEIDIEASYEHFNANITRVSFFITDELLKLIQDVGGGDAFLCKSHAQIVLETLLSIGAHAKKEELEAEAAQEKLF